MQIPLAERLEAGEILRFHPCPAPLPSGGDIVFLLRQRLDASQAKHINYCPFTGRVQGHIVDSPAQEKRLTELLRSFSLQTTRWLASVLPQYAKGWKPVRVTWRTEEEATRQLDPLQRNDLFHIDTFPDRPSHGARLLRVFVNLHPSDPQVWATGEKFQALLDQFGETLRLNSRPGSWPWTWGQGILSLFRPNKEESEYDRFMCQLQQLLKSNDDYQERAPRRLCHFQPGEAWLGFTDGICHAELRGQFALEHSYFVPLDVLSKPELAPASMLERLAGKPMLPRAA